MKAKIIINQNNEESIITIDPHDQFSTQLEYFILNYEKNVTNTWIDDINNSTCL